MIPVPEDPVVSELTSTLREWHKIWISLYLDNQTHLFDTIGTLLSDLIETRAELITALKQPSAHESTGGEQQINELKSDIINRLDTGNRLLNLDLIPRDKNFKVVDPVELSPINLFQIHSEATSSAANLGSQTQTNIYNTIYNCHESIISATGSTLSSCSQTSSDTATTSSQSAGSTHLQVSLKSIQPASIPQDEAIEVYFSILEGAQNNFSPNSAITEKFLIQVLKGKVVCGKPNTVFLNIGPLATRDLYLLVQVYRVGRMILADGHKSGFGKQTSSYELPSITRDSSMASLNSSARQSTNGLPRSRYSTVDSFDNTNKYKRPFGSTAVYLRDYTKGVCFRESDISIKIMSSTESEFSQPMEMKKNTANKLNQNLPHLDIDLSLKFISTSQETFNKFVNFDKFCLTEKRGFPDVVMPGDFKNDLFFTLESAEFEKGGKSISKNIEASISLINKAGVVIENQISSASNSVNVSSYKTCIFYHSNSPKWNESFKINVPLSEFDCAHIRIEFCHCSTKDREKKFLGFAYLPLSDEDGAVIADQSHELYIYKCDSQFAEDKTLNLCKYTSLPYGPSDKSRQINKSIVSNTFSHSNREIVTVSTSLLSTKLTQNRDLLNLFKWRELIKTNGKCFEESLKKVLTLKGEEIVKFLQDILDTLFDTFTIYSSSEDDYSALIFKVLVHIFLLLEEPKYQHFKPVVDTYASAHFSATLVFKGLLACLQKCVESSLIKERHKPIQRCFRSMKYVFQFIVQSRLLYCRATGGQNDGAFLNDLNQLFKQFENMLSNSLLVLIPIQVTFLESFSGALEPLAKVMDPVELARLVTRMADSVGFYLTSELSRAKLMFIKSTANSSLIKIQDARVVLVESFCCHLEIYLKKSIELELCHEVIEMLISKIHDYHWPSIHRTYHLMSKVRQSESISQCPLFTVSEIQSINVNTNQIQVTGLDQVIANVTREMDPFVNIIEPILHLLDLLVKDFNSDKPLIQNYCTCFLTILKLMSRSNYEQFMDNFKQTPKQKSFDYLRLCNLFGSFRAVYNRDWSIMQLTSHSILERAIHVVSRDKQAGVKLYQSESQSSTYIKLLVDFITHPTLQLESFSNRKRSQIQSVFGDLRMKFGRQLMRFWSDLTKQQRVALIPTCVQPLLDVALLPNEELQRLIIPVFYDMVVAEDSHKLNSRQFDRCFTDAIDLFFNMDRGNVMFINNFDFIMRRFIMDEPPISQQRVLELIKSLSHLMQLLQQYRESTEVGENRGQQMSCLVELLNFYKDQDRSDLHLNYLFKLSDIHLKIGNYTEAGFTLKLYTDEMRFCERNLSPIDGYRPAEQEWVRKEILYQRIINYFDIGKCWEEAIPLCKDLAAFYENFLVDYGKVSSILRRLAQFLDNILNEHRLEREYFRVEFLGAGAPTFVRGKQFIFRVGESERLPSFIQRLSSEFPEAKILRQQDKQTVNNNSSGQFMVVSNVKPRPAQEHLKTGKRNINEKIIQYYLNNRLDTFTYDMPLLKGAKGTGANGTSGGAINKEPNAEMNVRNLWVGRTILKLKKQLPGILPWGEIISQEYIEISPIDHAIETISNMNIELSNLILSYRKDPSKPVSPLTMRLQGVIEAAVNGGPSVFVSAFLKQRPADGSMTTTATGDNNENLPDQEALIRLSNAINQQFSLLQMGLEFHSKLIPPEVMPLHDRLVERLQTTDCDRNSRSSMAGKQILAGRNKA